MAKTKPLLPMSAVDRAKQFAPFSPLNGLHKALAEKEKVRVPRKMISEDKAQEINAALVQLQEGHTVTVVYYNAPEQEYVQLTGVFQRLDSKNKILFLSGARVPFADLYEIILV